MFSGSPYSYPGGVEDLAYYQPEPDPQANLRDLAYYQQQTFLPHIWGIPEDTIEEEEIIEEEEEIIEEEEEQTTPNGNGQEP